MPTVKFSPFGNSQTVNAAGAPASGWKIYTYQAGSSTPLATYTDNTGNVAQSNPIVINSLGFPTNGQIWLQAGLSYKMVLTDQNDVVQKTEDNITGVNDTASSVSEWVSGPTPTYISATSFSVAGDQRQTFQVGRRMRFSVNAGTVYGTVATSVYNGSSLTTITIGGGEGPLDSGLSSVSYGFLAPQNPSIPSVPIAAYAVRRLVGLNNAGASTTKYDVSADVVVLFNPATGGTVTKQNTGTLTCDVTVFGPNGRDQAGAFSASTWLHEYIIYNGSATLATVFSTSAPPTGPSLSNITGGYTYWAYVGAVYFSASSQLVGAYIEDDRAFYAAPQTALSAGGATVETLVNVAALVPPNAVSFTISGQSLNGTSNGSGDIQMTQNIGFLSGFNCDRKGVGGNAITNTGSTVYGSNTGCIELPNIGQKYYYSITVTAGSLPQATHNISSYKIPNGA